MIAARDPQFSRQFIHLRKQRWRNSQADLLFVALLDALYTTRICRILMSVAKEVWKPVRALWPQPLIDLSTENGWIDLGMRVAAIAAAAENVDLTKPLVPVSGFAIQIKPHHNGEIFLSKTAAQQNPAYFGMPFTGQTSPKKGVNGGYPQRTPDPVCNIVVFGTNNTVLYSTEKYALNTVFYTTKSEIRVTASPLVAHVPEYSVLIMTPSDDTEVDYEMQIFTPDSPDYAKWVNVCDQKMPGGGKVPRKFGWF